MSENIRKAIKQAEELVKTSEVSRELIPIAYLVTLVHLLRFEKNEVGAHAPVVHPTANPDLNSAEMHTVWSDLFEAKQPAGIYQLIALVLYYLANKKASDQQNGSFVTSKELVAFLENECYDSIDRKHLEKLGQAIAHAVSSYRYIRSVKKGVYELTPFGRKMISSLPEQLTSGKTK